MKNLDTQQTLFAFNTQTSVLLLDALTNNQPFALLAMSCHKMNERKKTKRTDKDGMIALTLSDINDKTSPLYSLRETVKNDGRVGFGIMYDNNDTETVMMPDSLLITLNKSQVMSLWKTLQSILKSLFGLESGSDVDAFKSRWYASYASVLCKEASVDDIIINLPVKFNIANKVAKATFIDVLGYKSNPQIALIINRPNIEDIHEEPKGELEAVLLFSIRSRRGNYKCFIDVGTTLKELVIAVNS